MCGDGFFVINNLIIISIKKYYWNTINSYNTLLYIIKFKNGTTDNMIHNGFFYEFNISFIVVFYFFLIMIPTFLITLLLIIFLNKITKQKDLEDKYFLFFVFISLGITSISIYSINLLFNLNLLMNYIFSGIIATTSAFVSLEIRNKYLIWIMRHSIGKKLIIDENWHYNGNLISFIEIIFFIIFLGIVIWIMGILYRTDIEILFWIIFFLVIPIFYFFSNFLRVPIKYKFDTNKIEFSYIKYQLNKTQVNNDLIIFLKDNKLEHPKDFQDSYVYQDPKVISIKNIYDYKISKDYVKSWTFIIMKDGKIFLTRLVGEDYQEQLKQILPESRFELKQKESDKTSKEKLPPLKLESTIN